MGTNLRSVWLLSIGSVLLISSAVISIFEPSKSYLLSAAGGWLWGRGAALDWRGK